ncbi:hypothetical protein DFA_10087 [Cavenderia fasciculata]|uniref:AAA+ ATPase domain-containing protein n=1 Tax=Cavenderia fasciculata TaxID=261658 RepID=F4Q984_CACFS|nr:uncharacterized protein DFA_10087 [Cavenderia fasciculata]EGG15253.1 hypothetical protein DFA_10087 [Cavenderia fasciculata]|eukprot:XP_004351973.1 hypothetical protein DFA_10087 [Cavenderia fasciculata]
MGDRADIYELDDQVNPDQVGSIPIQIGKGWKSLGLDITAKVTNNAFLKDQQKTQQQHQQSSVNQLPQVMSSALIKKKTEYYEKFKQLLVMESKEDKQSVERRLSQRSVDQLAKKGLALKNTTAILKGKLLSEIIVRFAVDYDPGAEVGQLSEPAESYQKGFLKIGSGESVIISKKDPLKDDVVYEGIYLETTGKSILVSIKNQSGFEKIFHNSGPWRIDLGTNLITMERMMKALTMVSSDKALYQTKLADIIFGHLKPGKTLEDTCATEYIPFQTKESPLKFKDMFPMDYKTWNLNPSQKDAIEKSICRRASLIQGPPGTGKSTTAIYLLRLLVHRKQSGKSNVKILATSFTNTGVDNLLEGLLKAGVNVLRLGDANKVREELRCATLEYRMEEELNRWDSSAKRSNQGSKPGSSSYYMQSEREIKSRLISEADVICSTCIGSGHEMLMDEKFQIIVVDEATQATEPAILIPLLKSSEQMYLFGDQNQLAPIILSHKAIEGGLNISMFDRLFKSGLTPFLLNTQYRMHSSISDFPRHHFYNGLLNNGTNDSNLKIPIGIKWPQIDFPVVFIDISNGREEIKHHSLYNNEEAVAVVQVAESLLENDESLFRNNIGIITPYHAQVKHINQVFSNDKSWRGAQPSVATVDSYQGREMDVIIFSTVRSNTKGNIGFLKDWRRLNVSITRAKRGLVVIGNFGTINNSSDEHWKAYVQWAKDKNIMVKSLDSIIEKSTANKKGKRKARSDDDPTLSFRDSGSGGFMSTLNNNQPKTTIDDDEDHHQHNNTDSDASPLSVDDSKDHLADNDHGFYQNDTTVHRMKKKKKKSSATTTATPTTSTTSTSSTSKPNNNNHKKKK